MFKHIIAMASAVLLIAGIATATPPMAPVKSMGKVTVIVKHEVKDYVAWKKGYDADAANRKEHKFTVSGVYTDVKNPNMVYVVGTFPSEDAANAFITSPKLKNAMEGAGVIGAPDIMIVRMMSK
jgi:hypothetical protein